MTAPAASHVTILMATYEGAAHLEEQLESFAAQTHENWALWVSDDGSQDETCALIDAFAARQPQPVRRLAGPKRGATANFFNLLCHPELPDGPVALADQDDVWYPDKLSRALQRLSEAPELAVYSARSRHVREDGSVLRASRRPIAVPSFGNALVQNQVSGHAAVLTPAALALVRAVGAMDVPFHDWWLYQLVTGAGGAVCLDDTIVLDYRQHKRNVLGAHSGIGAAVQRMGMVLGRTYPGWLRSNATALSQARPWLTPEAIATLDGWTQGPAFGLSRARHHGRLGLHRDRVGANAMLRLAAVLGRL